MFKNHTSRQHSRLKEYITPSDLKLLNNADLVSWRLRIIFNVLFYSAMRIGELHHLKPTHIIKEKDDQKDYYFIHLETQKSGVTDEYAPLRIDDYSSIKDYISAKNIQPQNFIFGSSKFKFQKPMTTSWFNIQLQQISKLVGIEKTISSHSFRKGRITQMRREKIPYDEIATVTRHQNINVLQKHYDKQIKFGAFDLVNQRIV